MQEFNLKRLQNVGDEVRSVELAITISDLTSASGITVQY